MLTNATMTANSVLIEDFTSHNWLKKDSEIITYNGVINFERAGKRDARHCVMCGLIEDGHNCLIPNQNKDVCRKCDSSYWLLKEFNVVIKFCKGCKTFFALMNYDEKPEASKCGTCRRRGRENYHNKKMKSADSHVQAMKRMRANTISPQEFCSLVNTMTEEDDEVIDVQTLLEFAAQEFDGPELGNFGSDTEFMFSSGDLAALNDSIDNIDEDSEVADFFTSTWLSEQM